MNDIVLYINGDIVDIDDSVEIPLNIVRDDVTDFFDKDSSYTKTFELPITDNNNRIFNNLFNINSLQNLWNYRSVEAVLYVDSLEVFRGDVILKKIKKSDDIRYEININSNEKGFFYNIEGLELEDIEWNGDGNHKFNLETLNDTNHNSDHNPFVYTIIDYGQFPSGLTNDITLKQYFMDMKKADVYNVFKPSVFVKSIIDKIFENQGYTYESKFMNEEWFKNLLIPYNIEEKENIRINDEKFLQFKDERIQLRWDIYSSTKSVKFRNLYDKMEDFEPIINNGQAFNDGNVKIEYDFNIRKFGSFDMFIDYEKEVNGYYVLNEGQSYFKLYLREKDSNNEYTGRRDLLYKYTHTMWVAEGKPTYRQIKETIYKDLKEDHFYELWVEHEGAAAVIKQNSTLRIIDNDEDYVFGSDNIISMNRIIPKGVKQRDFLVSILKMFNLYMYKISRDKFKIITRDDYYKEGKTKNFTDKVNRDMDFEIDLQVNENQDITFKFKDDDDYHNEYYYKRRGKKYGENIFNTGNIYSDKSSEIELIFAPTPFIKDKNFKASSYVILDNNWKTIMGKIGWEDKDGVDNEVEEGFTTKVGNYNTELRILFRFTDNFYEEGGTYEDDGYPNKPSLLLMIDGGGYLERYTTAVSLDYNSLDNRRDSGFDTSYHNKSNSYDLSFSNEWRDSTYWSGENLIYFWRNHIDNVFSKESRNMRAYLAFEASDINSLELNDKIYIHIDDEMGQSWYLINKIIDYIPQRDFTKVELLKVVNPETINIQYNYYPINITTIEVIDGGLNATLEGFDDLLDGGLNDALSGTSSLVYSGEGNLLPNSGFTEERQTENENELPGCWQLSQFDGSDNDAAEWTGDSIIINISDDINYPYIAYVNCDYDTFDKKVKFIIDVEKGSEYIDSATINFYLTNGYSDPINITDVLKTSGIKEFYYEPDGETYTNLKLDINYWTKGITDYVEINSIQLIGPTYSGGSPDTVDIYDGGKNNLNL